MLLGCQAAWRLPMYLAAKLPNFQAVWVQSCLVDKLPSQLPYGLTACPDAWVYIKLLYCLISDWYVGLNGVLIVRLP
jgi:hypothetical protein